MKLKGFLGILLAVAVWAIPLPAVQAAMPVIKADKQYYDIAQGVHVLKGNVYIAHKNRVVTMGTAKTNMVEVWGAGGVRYAEADHDITLTGSTIYANFRKKRVTLTDEIDFQDGLVGISADRVEFNWETKIAEFQGNVHCSARGTDWTLNEARYNVKTKQFM
ncbi:LptA/OstA family protein [Acetonema longum]|uniref:Organic solvent tolerance-like N-terminal domain-containing protein n=1 Tax=Acetonema longum DSM 6540 TaxID=1009370 RepID=F7NM67_9FIRM|nr:LptA/OstA family protein [Acetonema longum]EGO62868.1 hypothetical protein ALO_15972 [Acetonema longum DSM 6540]